MADVRERSRERGPEQETVYDRNLKERNERIRRMRRGRVVLRDRDLTWDMSRQGRLKFFTDPHSYGDGAAPEDLPALTDFKVFVHEIRSQSGRHRHQGGLVIYVIEGEGYTVVEGERVDWKSGDLLLLPVRPGGVEHQHFNTGDAPAQWVAFRFEPFHEALGDVVEQVVNSPEYDE
jgi:hypothetical protein